MKATIKFLSIVLLGLSISFSSCKKDKEDDSMSTDNVVAQDNMEASSTAEDVGGTVQQLMAENEGTINGRMAAEGDTVVKYRGVDSCATVTIYTKEKKIVVDFGTTGCKGKNGRTRTGKWLISYNKHWKNVGAEIHVNFENFAFERPNQVGWIQVSNSSHKMITTLAATDGSYDFKKEINLVTTLPSGLTRSMTGTRYVNWNTNQTSNRYDDIITIQTTSNEIGTDRKGRSYNVAVLSPVVIKTECWLQNFYKPVSGTIQISKIGKTKTIDFGNGSCGGTITVDVEGKKYTIGEGD